LNYKGLFGNLNQFTCVIGNLIVWVVGLSQVTGSLDCKVPLIGNPLVCPPGEEDIGPINRFGLKILSRFKNFQIFAYSWSSTDFLCYPTSRFAFRLGIPLSLGKIQP